MWVENTVGKGEIARYEQFLLFPQCFQKTCSAGKNQGLFSNGLRHTLSHSGRKKTIILVTNSTFQFPCILILCQTKSRDVGLTTHMQRF